MRRIKMSEESSIEVFFETLFNDKTEKKIMNLIIEGKDADEIVETLVSSRKGE